MKKKLALFLVCIIVLGQFSTATAGNVDLGVCIPDSLVIVDGEDMAIPRPLFLRPGEVWTGKSVVHNGNGTVTVSLMAWGRMYQGLNSELRMPLNAQNNYVSIDDTLEEFSFGYIIGDNVVGTITQGPNNTVTWRVHQDYIVGEQPAQISYIIYLSDDELVTGYWYSTGFGMVNYSFTPAQTNPFYWTKEETSYNAFTAALNWNNGNGLNSGTITDNVLDIRIVLGPNRSPAGQTAQQAVNNTYWANNALLVGSSETYWWHLYWIQSNQPKVHVITIRDLEGPGIDVTYELLFPNPGGNSAIPGGRTISSVNYFHRTFEDGNPNRPFNWDGDSIVGNLNIFAQVQFLPVPVQTGTVAIHKELLGWYMVDWGVSEQTQFNVVLWKEADGARFYLVFDPDEYICNQYAFTGTVGFRNLATVISFSKQNPAILLDVPVSIPDLSTDSPAIYFIEEIFDVATDLIEVTYTDIHGNSVKHPYGFTVKGGETTAITVTNEYKHGVGYLEIIKMLEGFPYDHGVTSNTEFRVRIWDVKAQNYLLFKSLDDESLQFRVIGNHEFGFSEEYRGLPVMEIPIRANNRNVTLSNLWTWGMYEVREVRPVSTNPIEYKWVDFWDNPGLDRRTIHERSEGETWEGHGWIENVWLADWRGVREITSETAWYLDYDWNWGVIYSENNGTRELHFNDTIFVSVTNRYKYSSGQLVIHKELSGYIADWAIDYSTLFYARVWDIPNIASPNERNLKMFERIRISTNNYFFRNIGHIDRVSGSYVFYGNYDGLVYITEIPFSVDSPALLTGLPVGPNKHYFVEEFFEDIRFTDHITVEYSFNNGEGIDTVTYDEGIVINALENKTLSVRIRNIYGPGQELRVIVKELEGHPGDWGVDGFTIFYAQIIPTTTTPAALHFVLEEDGRFRYVPEHYLWQYPEAVTDIPFSAARRAFLIGLDPFETYHVVELGTGNPFETGFTTRIEYDRTGIEHGGNVIARVINTYKHGVGQLTIKKDLVNPPYDVDGDTMFYATVHDRTDRDNLLFIPVNDATNTWRAVGNDFDGLSEYVQSQVHNKIPFSVNKPAVLTNLWSGRVYIVEEVPGNFISATPHQPEFMWNGDSLTVTVTNTFASEYRVTYHGNSNTAGVPPDDYRWYREGENVAVQWQGSLTRAGYSFVGWNTEADGSGIWHYPGDTFKMPANNVDFYAQWEYMDMRRQPDDPGRGIDTYPGDDDPQDNQEQLLPLYNEYPWYTPPEQQERPEQPRTPAPVPPPPPPGIPIGDGDSQNNIPEPGEFFVDEHIWFVRGDHNTEIRPDATASRADVAVVFYRLLRPEWKVFEPAGTSFNDVTGDEWFGRAVGILEHFGIIIGYEDSSFRPHNPISRREFAALVSRFYNLAETDINPFSDIATCDWAYRYILMAAQAGWFIGHDSMFRPADYLTRAEMVVTINRMLGRGILLADIPPDAFRFPDINESHWAFTDIMEAAHTHTYKRHPTGTTEIWIEILDIGLDAPYNK